MNVMPKVSIFQKSSQIAKTVEDCDGIIILFVKQQLYSVFKKIEQALI